MEFFASERLYLEISTYIPVNSANFPSASGTREPNASKCLLRFLAVVDSLVLKVLDVEQRTI
jgi:hypothetical protein